MKCCSMVFGGLCFKLYKARAPKGCPNPVNPLLDEYVYSWQWRTNCKAAGKSLWLQLGEEVFKA